MQRPRRPARIDGLRDALCARGRWGQKSGAGFYDYDENRKAWPSPVVADIIQNFRDKAGRPPRQISDQEIIVRTFYIVNEGANILDEDIAQRASDIDVLWHHGFGWPRHTGGPMYWADHVGLTTIVDGLREHANRLGPQFSLSPLLLKCALETKPLNK